MIVALPLLVSAAVFAATLLVMRRPSAVDPRQRIAAYLELRPTVVREEEQEPERLLDRFFAATEGQLRRLPAWARFEQLVDRADARARPIALAWILVGVVAVLSLLLLAAGLSPVLVVVLLALVLVGTRLWLAIRIGRRRRAFEEQLPELLNDLGSALRAGHSFNQALQSVAADTAPPAGKEFNRTLSEARLGRPLEDALADMSGRIGSRDLDFVLDAIVIQRQVGGSLAGIFAIVGETVRQRQQFALRVRALTAMGRMSALLLMALPPALALLLSAKNPSYLAPLVHSSGARAASIVCLVLFVVGAFWLRAIVSTKDAA